MIEQTKTLDSSLSYSGGVSQNGDSPPVQDGENGSVGEVDAAKNRKSLDLVSLMAPNSPLVEQYKALFTRMDQICLERGQRIIVVTSATHGEGKTTTASNLAVVAARNFGRKCLLMDVHFKNPGISPTFQLGRGLGLIDVMMSRRSLKDVLMASPLENLTLLPMGHFLGKKAGLLNVDGLKDVFAKIRGEYYNVLWNDKEDDFAQMELYGRDPFDYIFVDAPIVSAPEMRIVTDAADAIMLVVRANAVSKSEVEQAMAQLDRSKVIGSVLNFGKQRTDPAWTYGLSR